MSVSFSSKRVLFPNMVSKEIKPLAFLLSPSDLIVSLCLIVLLAQVSDSLKGFLSSKDVQKLSSVKLYSKLLCVGKSSISVSFVYAIAKTLGRDLDTLSVLSLSERISFLRSVHLNLIHHRLENNNYSYNNNSVFSDPFELLVYRRDLALQCRSVFCATPVFLPHSLVIGVPIKNVDLSLILESCKFLWESWGLDGSEFDFRLRKDAMKLFMNNKNFIPFSEPLNIFDCCKVILFSEFPRHLASSGKVLLEKDSIFLSNNENLTLLEKELGFFYRKFPNVSSDLLLNDDNNDNLNLVDDVLRLAIQQKKSSDFRFRNNVSLRMKS